MLGSLKDKFLGKKKHDIDYTDVRSHVLGERLAEPTVREKFGLERPAEFPREPYAPEPFQQPQFQQFPPRPEPRDLGMWREGEGFEQQPRRDYELVDRLNLIESQLAAIRSQTETINERLKNLEARLAGRRY